MSFRDLRPSRRRDEVHREYDFRDVRNKSVEKYFDITMYQCGMNVVRDHLYKYVPFSNLQPSSFNLINDPGEFANQAKNPDYRSRVLEYAQKMLSWEMNYTDRGLAETSLGRGGAVTWVAPLRKIAS